MPITKALEGRRLSRAFGAFNVFLQRGMYCWTGVLTMHLPPNVSPLLRTENHFNQLEIFINVWRQLAAF